MIYPVIPAGAMGPGPMPANPTPYETQSRARTAAVTRGAQWPYPWVDMPIDGRPFSRRGNFQAPAFGAGNQITLASFEVPMGYNAVVTHLFTGYFGTTAGGAWVNGTGTVFWSVDVNTPLGASPVAGYGLPDYALFDLSIGNAAYPWPVSGGWVLEDGDVIRVKGYTVATVDVGAGTALYGGVIGWVWPSQKGTGVGRTGNAGR